MPGLALTLVLGLAIALLAFAPISSDALPGSDKLHHFLAFAVLAFPLPFARPRLVWPVIVIVSLYGGLIELVQPVFGREASWGDLVADALGALCGGLLGALCGKICRRLGIIG
ncbi:MAG: VanZ family protein [Rhodobacteraceae bacterium]|nr:MAG: VanZ family protein [Paracoccaceae bacterium]